MSNGNTLASGTVPGGPFNSTQPHRMSLSMNGSQIYGAVAGTRLFTVRDTKYTAGMAAVGSGYHWAAFDDFAVGAPTGRVVS